MAWGRAAPRRRTCRVLEIRLSRQTSWRGGGRHLDDALVGCALVGAEDDGLVGADPQHPQHAPLPPQLQRQAHRPRRQLGRHPLQRRLQLPPAERRADTHLPVTADDGSSPKQRADTHLPMPANSAAGRYNQMDSYVNLGGIIVQSHEPLTDQGRIITCQCYLFSLPPAQPEAKHTLKPEANRRLLQRQSQVPAPVEPSPRG